MLLPRWRFSLALATALAVPTALIGSVAFCTHDAHASVVLTLTLPELVEKSDSIVVALPKSKVSKWEGGRIVTYTTIAIDTAVAGAAKAGDTLVVRTLGGVVGDVGQIAHGEAVLPLDKPIMLFLRASVAEKSAQKTLAVVGMAQGAMSLEVGTDKVTRVVARPMDLVLVPKPSDPKAVAASATLDAKPLPDAVKDIRTLWAARAKK
jgi:hypothetical protein